MKRSLLPIFDPLSPSHKRIEMSMTWGIHCKCKRCKFGEKMFSKQSIKEIEIGLERWMNAGGALYKLEEHMKRWKVKGKEKSYLKASFWSAYSEAYRSDRCMKRWGRWIPALDAVVDSRWLFIPSDSQTKALWGMSLLILNQRWNCHIRA